MLRISNPTAGPPKPPTGPPPGSSAPPPLPDMAAPPLPGGPDVPDPTAGGAPQEDAGKTSQHLVVYRGPEEGPFACGNCVHFDGQGSCEIVQGKIDPGGLCNIFESAPAGPDAGPDDPGMAPPPLPPPLNG